MMNGGSMSAAPIVITAALGLKIAAITCLINGRHAAAINIRARTDPTLCTEAAIALLCCGIDAGHAMGALHGVRR